MQNARNQSRIQFPVLFKYSHSDFILIRDGETLARALVPDGQFVVRHGGVWGDGYTIVLDGDDAEYFPACSTLSEAWEACAHDLGVNSDKTFYTAGDLREMIAFYNEPDTSDVVPPIQLANLRGLLPDWLDLLENPGMEMLTISQMAVVWGVSALLVGQCVDERSIPFTRSESGTRIPAGTPLPTKADRLASIQAQRQKDTLA